MEVSEQLSLLSSSNMVLAERLLLRQATRFTFDDIHACLADYGYTNGTQWLVQDDSGASLCKWRDINSRPYGIPENLNYCWNGPGQYFNNAERVQLSKDEAIRMALDISSGIIEVYPA